ncbi:MAG: hypothetical protein NVSMB2_17120 [Chloroflexota bacterium]
MRLLVVLCAALSSAAPAAAEELILSHTDPSVQVAGPWQSSSAPGGDARSPSGYLFRSGGGGATVFWPFPTSLSSGQYQVFARWTSAADRTPGATYWVASDDGTVSVTRNQQADGGAWQPLGAFMFGRGKSEGITLTDTGNGVVVADAVRWVSLGAPASPAPAAAPSATAAAQAPGSATPSPSASAAALPASQPPATPQAAPVDGQPWTVTIGPSTDLRAGPEAGTDRLAAVPQFSYLQVLGYAGDWAYVYNPRARGAAYVLSSAVGPSDPPPEWVTAPPPAPAASLEQIGRTVGKAPIAYYPVDDKFAYTSSLGHNVAVMIHDRLQAPDGSTWYRVDNGYLAAASVRLPRPPARTYSGRWIDADLQEPAMLTAYDGDRVVLNSLTIKGTIANQTPTGTFSIQRRVQDETMDSGTLGIDPHGPGGYHLEHVLNTQYFTNDGASIHYNYWSSNFGYSGSHGCLGVDLEVSQFIWNWADIGTPVVIHQ